MTNSEKIQELIDKIAAAQQEIDNLEFSLYNNNQPGGSWQTAFDNGCVAHDINTIVAGMSCKDIQNTILVPRKARIAKLKSDIAGYNSQIKILESDPAYIADVAASANRKKIWTYTIVIIVLTAVAVFVYRKWIRR